MHINYRYVLDKCGDLLASGGGRILDYGCGSGQVVEAGRAAGWDFWGCELFHAGGDRREEAAARGLLGDAVREMQDGRIPFPDGHFSLVVSNQVIEHVPDLDLTLDEIARVLRPGGRMLSIFPSWDSWREGHCGVPFAHRWPAGSRQRYRWLLGGRRLGLGSRKEGKDPQQWARDFADYLDRYTFYRTCEAVDRALAARFALVDHLEEDYMHYRLAHKLAVPGLDLIRRPPLRGAARGLYRRLGGVVVMAQKAGTP